MRIIGKGLLILFLGVMAPMQLNAEEKGLDTQKQKLIKELLEATDAQKLTEQVVNVLFTKLELDYPKILSEILTQANVSLPSNFEKQSIESFKRFSKKFRTLLPKEINFGNLNEEIAYPLYDKYYTTQELQDLVEFYKTPTGQKVLKTMPALMAESMQRSSKILNPIIMRIMRKIFEEEKGFWINKSSRAIKNWNS